MTLLWVERSKVNVRVMVNSNTAWVLTLEYLLVKGSTRSMSLYVMVMMHLICTLL